MSIDLKKQELLTELGYFEDWAARYEYVIDLGKRLAPLPEASRIPENLIRGCQSQVWLDAFEEDGKMRFVADSDSVITKGMIALFVRVLDGQTVNAVLTADLSFIDQTGLKEHLAPTRANALKLMATQMKQRALNLTVGR